MHFMTSNMGGIAPPSHRGHAHSPPTTLFMTPSPAATRRHTLGVTDMFFANKKFPDYDGSNSICDSNNSIHMSDMTSTDRKRHRRTHSKGSEGKVNGTGENNNILDDPSAHKDLEADASTGLLQNKIPHEDNDRASSYGNCCMETLNLGHDCELEGCERVIINVSGLKFETQLRTLNRLPHTLLGNPKKRREYWDVGRQEFFFDRHRPTFQAVLYYYQSGGRLKKPLEVPMDIFLHELHFFELGMAVISCFKEAEGCIMENKDMPMPEADWKKPIWEMVEAPESSIAAKIFATLSLGLICTSVITFCLETMPQFKNNGCENQTFQDINGTDYELSVVKWHDPLYIIECVCITFFVVELILRFTSCPSKMEFLKDSINWIDLLAITPFFIFLGVNLATGTCGSGSSKSSVLSVLRVLRVVRILKLSKHSEGLKILGKTMTTSIRELSMFVLFLGIATVIFSGAIFHAENGTPGSMFTSIPDAFWWAIVTMTTVGYGDYVPVGYFGKCLGGFCVLSGVLCIALPVPVIVANFNNYYRHYTASVNA